MPRCGCATPDCGCTLTAGDGIVVTGQGSAENPFVVSANEGLTKMRAESTTTIQLTMTGIGTSANPYVLTAVRTGSAFAGNTVVQVFDASDTWTKPAGKNFVQVTMVGGGGGGASGAVAPAGSTYSVAGGGGAGGGYTQATFLASELAATLSVVVGAGGAGGVATSGAGTGVKGQNGGDSIFGTYRAGGGKGGVWTGNSVSLVTADFAGGIGTETGASGTQTVGVDGNTQPGPDGGSTYQAGPSGGAGGSPNADDGVTTDVTIAGAGGAQGSESLVGGIAGRNNPPTTAGAGLSPGNTGAAGSGGGGGAGAYANFSNSVYHPARPGGNGSVGAGGGGGGGANTSLPLPGSGGSGGNGRVVVTSW